MHILSLFCLCYFIQFSNCFLFSNILNYLGFRPPCYCRCGIVNSGHYSLLDKIRGVDPIPPYTMPWLVFIHANDSVIPGTLISNRHVITAASRVYDLSPSTVFVQIGSNNFCNNNGLNFTVEAIRIPGGYTLGGDNDLALLRLTNEVSFNQYVSPICLPFSWRDYTRRTATVTTLPIYGSGSRCIARPTIFSLLEGSTCSYQANFTLDKGCVEPTGPLYITLSDEDVGSPVMTRRPGLPHLRPFRLIGVLSSASNSSEPSIYTKINDHRSFIYQNTQGDCMCV